MKPDNWKWNPFWSNWQNVDKFTQIAVNPNANDEGIYPVNAICDKGCIYIIALLKSAEEAEEWLDKFMNGDFEK